MSSCFGLLCTRQAGRSQFAETYDTTMTIVLACLHSTPYVEAAFVSHLFSQGGDYYYYYGVPMFSNFQLVSL